MEKPKNIQMENYVFMEQDEIQLLYPLSVSEGEIFEYIEYLETLLKDGSKVRILNTEISLNLFMYLKEKNYVFMEQDEIQLLYPLSVSEGEIFEYIEYLETLLKDGSKVRILNTEISLNLFMYLKEKNIELYVPESIYKQIEKLSLNSQEDTKYSKIYKYEEDFI
jgi:molybdopterin converting factor small subunit